MSLAGLILTDDDVLGGGASARTLLPVAGQTLIEYQVRIAHACGAAHIVVLVDRIPGALVSAFDRLRADGMDVDVARDAREAADRIHPDERLLVMAGGVVAGRAIVETLARRSEPTLLTLDDAPETGHFERIDGQDRWGGLALLNGQLLRATAAILGDWTLGPTLLRAALQEGVSRSRHEGGGLALIQNERDAQAIAHVLASGSGSGGMGFWQAQVIDPVVRRILPLLIGRNVRLAPMIALPIVLLGIALLAGGTGWIATSFGLFLVSGYPAAAAKIMADIAARPDRILRAAAEARTPVLLSLLAFAGWSLDLSGLGWGPLALGLWAGVALLLQPKTGTREFWHADADLIALELLVASLIGQPVFGLMVAVGHAVVTQFWLVRRSS